MSDSLAANVQLIRTRIADAALQWRRDPGEITLLAVSKEQPTDAIRTLAGLGIRSFGESYLQEALPKLQALSPMSLDWHYIGQIQSNKTRPIAEHFSWVHTVDRIKIAERLSEQRPDGAAPLNICLQVKLEEEPGKGGALPDELFDLAQRTASLPKLRLRGLMCIPPPRERFDEQRELFERCASLQRSLCDKGLALDTLSMGMSGDLEAAVAAGSTVVRVGMALFGARRRHD